MKVENYFYRKLSKIIGNEHATQVMTMLKDEFVITKKSVNQEEIIDLGIQPIIPVTYRLVINSRNYQKKDGRILLEFDLTQGKKRRRISTHIYIPDMKYFRFGILQRNCPNYHYLKSQISIEEKNLSAILEVYNLKNEPYDIDEVIDAYKNRISKSATLSEFFESQMTNDGRCAKTMDGYRSTIRSAEKVISNITLLDMNEHNIRKLEAIWKSAGIANNTISSRLGHLRAICNKAIALGLLKNDPFDKIKIKSMTKKEGTLSSEEMDKFRNLHVAKEDEYVKDIALLAAYTGLRFSDVTRLTSDMFKDGWITVQTQKTKKKVNIPYRQLRDGNIIDDIISKYGKIEKLTKRKWINSVVNKKLKTMYRTIGIADEKNFTFHTLRHFFATNTLRSGLPAEIVQQLLGHTKIQTTLIYTEIDKETIQASIENAKLKGLLN